MKDPPPPQGWGKDQKAVSLQSLLGRGLWVTATASWYLSAIDIKEQNRQ